MSKVTKIDVTATEGCAPLTGSARGVQISCPRCYEIQTQAENVPDVQKWVNENHCDLKLVCWACGARTQVFTYTEVTDLSPEFGTDDIPF